MSKESKDLIEEYWPHYPEITCEYCGKERYCSKACRNEVSGIMSIN